MVPQGPNQSTSHPCSKKLLYPRPMGWDFRRLLLQAQKQDWSVAQGQGPRACNSGAILGAKHYVRGANHASLSQQPSPSGLAIIILQVRKLRLREGSDPPEIPHLELGLKFRSAA